MPEPRRLDVTLRSFRSAARLTQRQLAGRLGLAKETIAHYETGRCCPSADVMYRLSEAFGTAPDFWAKLNARGPEAPPAPPRPPQLWKHPGAWEVQLGAPSASGACRTDAVTAKSLYAQGWERVGLQDPRYGSMWMRRKINAPAA